VHYLRLGSNKFSISEICIYSIYKIMPTKHFVKDIDFCTVNFITNFHEFVSINLALGQPLDNN